MTASFTRRGFSPNERNAARRVAVDHVQDVVAVPRDQPRRPRGADVLDAPQVRRQRRARRRDRLGDRHVHLQPVAPVLLPHAAHHRALARLQVPDRPDQHDLVPVPVGVEHAEAGVLAGEPAAADDDLTLECGAGDHGQPTYAASVSGGHQALPDDVAPQRLARRALQVFALVVVLILIAVLTPGLGDVRDLLTEAAPGWMAIAVVFELLSCASYVLMFRPIFCRAMGWRTSWRSPAPSSPSARSSRPAARPASRSAPGC